ncbi:MAG: glycosyltransferase family 2 protein [Lachnospiraceae bacterium]|nr:glycosyltransferase family 2 protein [Lachnospiraceae bacterium]
MSSKILTVTVPCYNSAAFMGNCLDSLVPGGETLEILVVDDGSPSDNTWEIAQDYEKKYPDIIRAIHQENGGFGQAVNTGMREATGKYFCIVDADDCVNTEALLNIMDKLEELEGAETPADLFLVNYVYRKEGSPDVSMNLKGAFPTDRLTTWDQMGRFSTTQYMMIHNLIYRKDVLDKTKLTLPSHICYSDNLLVMCPLRHVHSIYYMDVDYYLYTIGRPDQSVNETVQIRQLDQQLHISRLVIDSFSNIDHRALPRKLYRYMVRNLALMLATTSIFLYIRNEPGDLKKKKAIWKYARKKCPDSYFLLRTRFLSIGANLPGHIGRWLSVWGYNFTKKRLNFR